MPNGWISSASKVLSRRKRWSASAGRWSTRTLNWCTSLSCGSTEVRFWKRPSAVGVGTLARKAPAMGSMRSAGMRLPANGWHAPLTGSMVSGSQIGSQPEKSPARTAASGTEKVLVIDRRVSCRS